jgi:hypothetical protein
MRDQVSWMNVVAAFALAEAKAIAVRKGREQAETIRAYFLYCKYIHKENLSVKKSPAGQVSANFLGVVRLGAHEMAHSGVQMVILME